MGAIEEIPPDADSLVAKDVIVHVNGHRVKLPRVEMTGHQVKKFAIEQGVDIKANFSLFEEIGHEQTRFIDNHTKVAVFNEARFLADIETVQIEVNGHAVLMAGRHQTGLEIKTAAIDQHVRIKLDFVLLELLADHKTQQIKDDQLVTIIDCTKFDAIPDDDHS